MFLIIQDATFRGILREIYGSREMPFGNADPYYWPQHWLPTTFYMTYQFFAVNLFVTNLLKVCSAATSADARLANWMKAQVPFEAIVIERISPYCKK